MNPYESARRSLLLTAAAAMLEGITVPGFAARRPYTLSKQRAEKRSIKTRTAVESIFISRRLQAYLTLYSSFITPHNLHPAPSRLAGESGPHPCTTPLFRSHLCIASFEDDHQKSMLEM